MTTLEIHFNSPVEIELRLERDGSLLERVLAWPAPAEIVDKTGIDFHFDTMLVTTVDKILKRNKILAVSLDKVLVTGQYEQSSVSYFVTLAVASALKNQ